VAHAGKEKGTFKGKKKKRKRGAAMLRQEECSKVKAPAKKEIASFEKARKK